MSGALTIWARQRLADIKERLREVGRRQVRKIVELALTDIDLMARLRDAGTTLGIRGKAPARCRGLQEPPRAAPRDARASSRQAGLHLEFGVYKGDLINHFAELRQT